MEGRWERGGPGGEAHTHLCARFRTFIIVVPRGCPLKNAPGVELIKGMLSEFSVQHSPSTFTHSNPDRPAIILPLAFFVCGNRAWNYQNNRAIKNNGAVSYQEQQSRELS